MAEITKKKTKNRSANLIITLGVRHKPKSCKITESVRQSEHFCCVKKTMIY